MINQYFIDKEIPIDYTNRSDLTSLLVNNGQHKIGEEFTEFIYNFGKITNIEEIAKLWLYIKNNFKQDKEHKIKKFTRTSEQIFFEKIYSGCSDMGTLIAPILRANGIPTIYLQCARIDWVKDLIENNNEKSFIRGHIFLEIFLNNSWILFDSANGYIYLDYNFQNYSLPNNYYVFSKSLNGHEIGCKNLEDNNKIMTRIFKNFDLNKYEKTNYIEIDLRNPIGMNYNELIYNKENPKKL